jgi:hypothetical protein
MEENETSMDPGSDHLESSEQLAQAPHSRPADYPTYVYALGQIQLRFPSLAIEKEFAQAIGRAGTAGQTDHEALEAVLSDRANRYLTRQVCWVLAIEGMETYLLSPRDPADFELLTQSVRARPEPTDLDLVVGVLGPLSPPEACGLVIPVVAFDQLYSFDRDTLLGAIPSPEGLAKKDEPQFRAASAELFDRILQMADNAGASDEHRALNYLTVRYPAIYARTAAAHAENATLTAVDVRSSPLSGLRKIVDVIFSYTNRQTDVTEKHFVRVDVTEEFPFLVTKLSPYYDR